MAKQHINVFIEELELSGLAADQGDAVSRALQQELGRLMTERGVPEKLLAGQTPSLSPLQVNPTGLSTSTPASMGRAVARAMYRGFNQ